MGIRPPLFPGPRQTRKSGSAYNLVSEISPRMLHTQPRWLPSASRASSEVMTKSRDTQLLSKVVIVTGYTDNTSHTSMSVQCEFKSLPSMSTCSINHSCLLSTFCLACSQRGMSVCCSVLLPHVLFNILYAVEIPRDFIFEAHTGVKQVIFSS